MTLSTDVLIEGKIRPQDVFWFCRRNLLELADDEGTWADEITYFWSKDKSASPPEDHPWQIHNHLGQGFPAILSVEYRPGGEPLRTEEDFHRHDEYCNIPGNPEFHDPNEELCDGEHNYQRPCYLKVNFDTGYSYSDDLGRGCGDLHAAYIRRLGLWLDAQGVPFMWENEFTGEFHRGYEKLSDLGNSGEDAKNWMQNIVLPAIAANIESGGLDADVRPEAEEGS